MRAALLYGAADVRVEHVPDPRIEAPSDALVRVLLAAVCGSDLWPYRTLGPTGQGVRLGHEFVGVVTETGGEVTGVRPGDVVVAPFRWSDGTCEFCREGLHTSCLSGGSWGGALDGGQGEAVRVPRADGTLVRVPVEPGDPRLPAVLTLADVLGTGHHAALAARVRPGATVLVVGDGAVGLCGTLAASRLGAERIIVLGRHPARAEVARAFGATDVVAARGEEAVRRVHELTGGHGAHAVLECAGTVASLRTALDAARPGGAVGYVGVPREDTGIDTRGLFRRNVTLAGGVAPVRRYIPELLPEILDGGLDPSPVFDRTVGLDGVPAAYAAMDAREAIKVLITP
ncbi:zinc-dependent alcohol dehydrogenase family protein [Spongiactinospora sp. TRM90649]|uniref:zinc-dependent alcohol dehydrogenase family protein n=1 Tax=Spongiactinospora sp. TRM90649 TaxID=3031114 RepID=UPI0023FA300F|nr:zinc-dependent alcohol dehydrogenase family protein [Spongiactinospora sp. TRM90649]MDF5756207.1 zinc-dependent alcohol dehydrogenase family protein [Spongiactinospora sp. TRM90649]